MKQHIEDNKLPATESEIAVFLQRKQLMMKNNRIKLDVRRDQIRQMLAETSLTTDARTRLEKERLALDEMDKAMTQAENRAGSVEGDAAALFINRASPNRWMPGSSFSKMHRKPGNSES